MDNKCFGNELLVYFFAILREAFKNIKVINSVILSLESKVVIIREEVRYIHTYIHTYIYIYIYK
jgi:hypothetical protein